MPRARPPSIALGRLTSRPIAAAVTPTTTRLKNSPAASALNRGAISTPAKPANSDDSAQAKAETRSEAMPLSSDMRGLSTTARIRSPTAENLNSAPSASTATTAIAMAAISLRLKEYMPSTW